ncbi:hypothetical protein B0H19DRAFT_1187920, partial [Mycena capillaripes]
RSAASIRAALRWIAQRRLYRLRRITMHVSQRAGGQGHRPPVYACRVAHTRPRRYSSKCARLVHLTCSRTPRLRRNLRWSARQLPYLARGFFDVPHPLRRARTTGPSPPPSLLPHGCASKRRLSSCPAGSTPRRRSERKCDVPRRAGGGTYEQGRSRGVTTLGREAT